MSLKPQAVKDGLQFWPIPALSQLDAAFGFDLAGYFKRSSLPDVPRQYEDAAHSLFSGGMAGMPDLAKGVDKWQAAAVIRSMLISFAPSHEAKIATAAYALWVWSTPEIVGGAA